MGISGVILELGMHGHGTLFQALLGHGYVTSEHNAAECIEVIFFVARLNDLGQVLFLLHYSLP